MSQTNNEERRIGELDAYRMKRWQVQIETCVNGWQN